MPRSGSEGTSDAVTDPDASDDSEGVTARDQDPVSDVGSKKGDSKPPCDPCSAELVVRTQGPATNVRVQGKYVYFADYSGAYRVDRHQSSPCDGTSACKEVVAEGSFSSVGVSDKLVCWSNSMAFGCADVDDLTKRKEVSAQSLAVADDSRILFNGTNLYFVQGDHYSSPDTLVGGNALGIAAGTSVPANLSETHARVGAFALDASHIVWNQEKDGARIMVKAIGGGSPTPIAVAWAGVASSHDLRSSSLALSGKYAYLSTWHGDHIYRAPIDGSEEAKPLVALDALGSLVVNASGIYVTFGDSANGVGDGVGWLSLDPSAPNAMSKILVQPKGTATGLDVADDALYYSEERSTASGLWRINFQ